MIIGTHEHLRQQPDLSLFPAFGCPLRNESSQIVPEIGVVLPGGEGAVGALDPSISVDLAVVAEDAARLLESTASFSRHKQHDSSTDPSILKERIPIMDNMGKNSGYPVVYEEGN